MHPAVSGKGFIFMCRLYQRSLSSLYRKSSPVCPNTVESQPFIADKKKNPTSVTPSFTEAVHSPAKNAG